MLNQRVLLVDDEPQVRSFIRTFLLAAHFDVIEAGDGVEALDMLVSESGRVDLLITDIKMPRMDGIALACSVAAAFPALPVLLISGYTPEPSFPEDGRAPLRRAFLPKPFLPRTLLEKVAALLPAEPSIAAAAED